MHGEYSGAEKGNSIDNSNSKTCQSLVPTCVAKMILLDPFIYLITSIKLKYKCDYIVRMGNIFTTNLPQGPRDSHSLTIFLGMIYYYGALSRVTFLLAQFYYSLFIQHS